MLVASKLDIGHKKTCDCALNHSNCLTAKEWIKNQIGVWQFYYDKRDIRDKEVHPAVFPIALSNRVISLFTHKGELVVDPFMGAGTTLVSARELHRNAVGFDINEKYVELAESRLPKTVVDTNDKQLAIWDDSRNIDKYFEPDTISLTLTSPPYANLLNRARTNKSRRGKKRQNNQYLKVEQYSQDIRDLGILVAEDYEHAIAEIYSKILSLTKPGGHAVINVPDMWWRVEGKPGNGIRIPLHINVYNAFKSVGWEFRNTIIWDRTNIVNAIGIFGWPNNYITMGTTFEYILDFWKPPGAKAVAL